MNGWYFLATEVDDICFDYATKNVEQNNLSDLIKGERGALILKISGIFRLTATTISVKLIIYRWSDKISNVIPIISHSFVTFYTLSKATDFKGN